MRPSDCTVSSDRPSAAPRSEAALERFVDFCKQVHDRLQAGKQTYGDASFERPIQSLIEEIRQEILDQAGWAFILYDRLSELEQKVKQAQ